MNEQLWGKKIEKETIPWTLQVFFILYIYYIYIIYNIYIIYKKTGGGGGGCRGFINLGYTVVKRVTVCIYWCESVSHPGQDLNVWGNIVTALGSRVGVVWGAGWGGYCGNGDRGDGQLVTQLELKPPPPPMVKSPRIPTAPAPCFGAAGARSTSAPRTGGCPGKPPRGSLPFAKLLNLKRFRRNSAG